MKLWSEIIADANAQWPKRDITYRPPVENVCPSCGAKHMGISQACSPCRDALASGK